MNDSSKQSAHDHSVNSLSTMARSTESPSPVPTGTQDPLSNTQFAQTEKDWRFWALLASISLSALLMALEGTITSTALPSIVNDLGGGPLYIWVVNGYLFAA